MNELKLSVKDVAGIDRLRPVSGGVPFAQGAVPADARFTVRDLKGERVACQSSVLARWADGTVRWALLDFEAQPPPGGEQQYRLTWEGSEPPAMPATPVEAVGDPGFSLRSGAMSLDACRAGLLRIADRVDLRFVAVDADGVEYAAVADSVALETVGPLRSTLCFKGAFRGPDGGRWFSFRLWATVYAGLSIAKLEPLILVDADSGMIQRISELRLDLVPDGGVRHAAIGGDPGWSGAPDGATRLLQVDDQRYVVEGDVAAGAPAAEGARAPGWVEFGGAPERIAVALRNFWQQWPKALEVCPNAVSVALLPRFAAGAFDYMGPWYKHDYLFEGDCYRLREGQARRWQVWVDLAGDGATLSAMADAPLVLVADPEQAMTTGVWGRIAPAGAPGMAEYDEWAEGLFDAYCAAIADARDYGAMNWGDWWGERGVNWGNHEYDTPKHALTQFARTGDPKYLYLGDTSARHYAEVDVVHALNPELVRYFEQDLGGHSQYPTRVGMVHEHSVGHVGGFHSVATITELYIEKDIGQTKTPYLCLDPYNLGHIFTEGMAYQYFLTGDPWTRETLERIGGNIAQLVEDRVFDFTGEAHAGRQNGWTMLALAGVYELDLAPRYLGAMRLLADDALGEQDPYCGGWLYPLPWGHCFCEKRKHVGEAGFITSVRLNGLARYYDLSGDERILDSVRRAVTHMNNDLWKDEQSDWRYTSCPGSAPIHQQGVIIMALTHSVRLTGEPEHDRILRRAWAAKFARLKAAASQIRGAGAGKSYSAAIYGCPEAATLFARQVEDS
jgi:hypothetical protein